MRLGHDTNPGQACDSDVLGRDSGVLPSPTCLGFVFFLSSPPGEPALEKKSLIRSQIQETLWDWLPKERVNVEL